MHSHSVMKILAISATVLLAACSISPVISEPGSGGGDRYSDCRRVSRDYCRDVEMVSDEDRRRCVSDATYKCVTGIK